MATLYSEIYDSFLEQVSDTDLFALTTSNRELLLYGFMNRACNKFNRICTLDLTDRDETVKQFNVDLTNEDIDIITAGMIVEWLRPKYLFSEHMKVVLNTKDYNLSSPWNTHKETRESYKTAQREFESMVNKYSYIHGTIEDLSTEDYYE
jgi:hypothetical protein